MTSANKEGQYWKQAPDTLVKELLVGFLAASAGCTEDLHLGLGWLLKLLEADFVSFSQKTVKLKASLLIIAFAC